MRSAGEDEDEDDDDGDGDESTATAAAAATAAVVDAAALIALGDCGWPPASGAAARTTGRLLSILCISRRGLHGTGDRWASLRGGKGTTLAFDDSELERMPVDAAVDVVLAGNILFFLSLSRALANV